MPALFGRLELERADADGNVDALVARDAHRLQPDAVLAAADDTTLHARVAKGIEEGFQNDGIFGVPTFIYRGEPFWGNDRIEWLVRAIQRG